MFSAMQESPLYPIVNPKQIAFFGASNSFAAMGTYLLASVQALGFPGTLYPIHPQEETVRHLKAYRSVLDVPFVPDLAIIVLPTRLVIQTLEQCGQKGIKHAIVVSAGFKEIGPEGSALEQELVATAKRYNIRFIGPNCIGVTNPHQLLNTTFMHYKGPAGWIGMASQSGSFVTQMFDYLARLDLGFSTAFSVGNEANIDVVDCLEYLGACPHTRVIALYLEGLRRGRDFVRVAREIVPHKPIVALYVGGSSAGMRAGRSHTGALAGPDRLYEGIFRQSGVLRARNITELFDFCWVLGTQPPAKGRNVVIQTHSGGPGATAADACGRAGLELPALSANSMARLASFLPHTGSINNPVDITYSKNPLDYFQPIPQTLLEDEKTDVLLMYFLLTPQNVTQRLEQEGLSQEEALTQAQMMIDLQAESIAQLAKQYPKPLLGYNFRGDDDPFTQGLIQRGVPVFSEPERAARAIEALVRYQELKQKIATQNVSLVEQALFCK